MPGSGGLAAANADVLEGEPLDVPKGLGASPPKGRAGGVPADPVDDPPDENDGRAGFGDPNADPLAGTAGADDGLVAGSINSPKRVGGGSCFAGAVGAVEGGGMGERTGAALMDAEAVALMVAAAGCGADVSTGAALSAGLPLSSLPPRLNKRPIPPATAPAVTAAAVVATEGLAVSAFADAVQPFRL